MISESEEKTYDVVSKPQPVNRPAFFGEKANWGFEINTVKNK